VGVMGQGEAPSASVPAVEKARYYAVQLIDGNTFNYATLQSVRHAEW
jgi:hypothetical protein